MPSDIALGLMIAVTTAVVFATRVAGPVLMSWVAPNPRLERFLDGLAVSVIVALVASMLASSGPKLAAAVFVSLATMAVSRSVIWAMIAGMITAAAYQEVILP